MESPTTLRKRIKQHKEAIEELNTELHTIRTEKLKSFDTVIDKLPKIINDFREYADCTGDYDPHYMLERLQETLTTAKEILEERG